MFGIKTIVGFALLILIAIAAIWYDGRMMDIKIAEGCHIVSTEMTPPTLRPELSVDGKLYTTLRSGFRENWRCPDGETFTRTR